MERGGVLRRRRSAPQHDRCCSRKRLAQVSMEYLFIMGFALLLAIPLIALYFDQSSRFQDQTTSATIQRAANQIAEAADTVYYLGAPSFRTLVIDLPDNVESVSLSGKSITFTVSSGHGPYEQPAWSAANLTGSFGVTEGPHTLTLAALSNGFVNITEG